MGSRNEVTITDSRVVDELKGLTIEILKDITEFMREQKVEFFQYHFAHDYAEVHFSPHAFESPKTIEEKLDELKKDDPSITSEDLLFRSAL